MNIYVFECKIHTNIKVTCITKKGLRQMFTVLNSSVVLYLNLIGQNKYYCQSLTKRKRRSSVVKIRSQGPNFDHSAQSEWSLLNKRRNTAK